MFKTRGSSNSFNIVSSVCSLTEYCLPLSVFLDQQYNLSVASPHSGEWEKHCTSSKRSTNVTRKREFQLVKHGELS
jgi:hypothetical protein